MWLFTLWWWKYWSCGLCAAIIFVMPLVFNICNGYSAGTGHLSWYLTNTKSSSLTVPKISRVILGLLLGSHHLRPACVYQEWSDTGGKNGCGQFTNTVLKEFHRSFSKHPVFMILPHIGGQALSVEVSTDLLAYWWWTCIVTLWKDQTGNGKSGTHLAELLTNYHMISALPDPIWQYYQENQELRK